VRADTAERELTALRTSIIGVEVKLKLLKELESCLEVVLGVQGRAGVEQLLQGYQSREIAALKDIEELRTQGQERLRQVHEAQASAERLAVELQVRCAPHQDALLSG
jgi:hypothetical protein